MSEHQFELVWEIKQKELDKIIAEASRAERDALIFQCGFTTLFKLDDYYGQLYTPLVP
jgi:hypothetical protein